MRAPLELLRQLGPGSVPPRGAKERVQRGLLMQLGMTVPEDAALPDLPVASPAAGAPWTLIGLAPQTLKVGLLAMLAGGLMGAVAFATFGPERLRVVYVDRPVLIAAHAAPAAPIAPAATASAVVPTPAASVESLPPMPGIPRPAATADVSASSLVRERALLDRARRSLAEGSAEAALRVTALHRLQHVNGKLTEEREALAIRALLALGRQDEASARGRAFAERFPQSLLAPALQPALTP